MITRLLIMLLIWCSVASLIGSPADELNSPSQKVRDAAAKILRSSYQAPPRTNWDSVVNAITNGMKRTNILELLSPFKVKPEPGLGGGGTYNEIYRLDGAWMLVCWYRDDGDVLINRTFSESLQHVWVESPTNFTGTWITYLINGQKCCEIHYTNGQYNGEFIVYNPDGSRSLVKQFKRGVSEGEETGFYSSGRIKHRGFFKGGKQVGTWIWYGEDGSTNSTKKYTK